MSDSYVSEIRNIPREFIRMAFETYPQIIEDSLTESERINDLIHYIKEGSLLKQNEVVNLWERILDEPTYEEIERFIIVKFQCLEISRGTMNYDDQIPAIWIEDILYFVLDSQFESKSINDIMNEIKKEKSIKSDLENSITEINNDISTRKSAINSLLSYRAKIDEMDSLIKQINDTLSLNDSNKVSQPKASLNLENDPKDEKVEIQTIKSTFLDVEKKLQVFGASFEKMCEINPEVFNRRYIYGNYKDIIHFFDILKQPLSDFIDASSDKNQDKSFIIEKKNNLEKFMQELSVGFGFFNSFKEEANNFMKDCKSSNEEAYNDYLILLKEGGIDEFDAFEEVANIKKIILELLEQF